jgi:hypothetical protein
VTDDKLDFFFLFPTNRCYADGYPAPTYRWFRYEDGVGSEIKPLKDPQKRITISGGSLIINNPNPVSVNSKKNKVC